MEIVKGGVSLILIMKIIKTGVVPTFDTDIFKKEMEKCILLCKNCQINLHNPKYKKENLKENGDL